MEDLDSQLLDGKYKIIRELGVGGFGRVVLAADTVCSYKGVA